MNKIGRLGTFMGCMLLLAMAGRSSAEPGLASHLGQVAPLRQDSVKVPSPADLTKEAPQPALTPSPDLATAPTDALPGAPPFPVGGYDPAGRRDPFSPVLSQLAPGQTDPT